MSSLQGSPDGAVLMFYNPGASSVLHPDSQGRISDLHSISHDYTRTESVVSAHAGEKCSSHVCTSAFNCKRDIVIKMCWLEISAKFKSKVFL